MIINKLISHSKIAHVVPIIILIIITFITTTDTLNWTDDIMFMDPGVNFARGLGWTSSVWPSQSYKDFFWGNNLLYPLLISVWVKLFGFTFYATKIFNFLLGISCLFLLFSILRAMRANFNTVIFVLTLCMGSTWVQYIITHQRGELIQIILLLSIINIVIRDKKIFKVNQIYFIFPITALIFFTGIQSILSIIMFFIIIYNYNYNLILKYYKCILLGYISGIFIWFIIGSAYIGVYSTFITTFAAKYSVTGQFAQILVFQKNELLLNYFSKLNPDFIVRNIFSDYLLTLYFLYFIYSAINNKLNLQEINRNISLFAIIFIGILLFCIFGRFERYYYPIVLFPALICYSIFDIKISKNTLLISKNTNLIFMYLILFSNFLLNFDSIKSVFDDGLLGKYYSVHKYAEENLRIGDHAMVDPIFYIPAREISNHIFSYTYGGGRGYPSFINNENNEINKIICAQNECQTQITRLGSSWELLSRFFINGNYYSSYYKPPHPLSSSN